LSHSGKLVFYLGKQNRYDVQENFLI